MEWHGKPLTMIGRRVKRGRSVGCVGSQLAFAFAALLASSSATAQALPRLHAEASTFTVSGLSSGGYMAAQIAVAHSARINGVGIFAAGPYYCAEGKLVRALRECTQGSPAAAETVRHARRFASAGWIDDVSHLTRTRVWLLAGGRDGVVAEPVVRAARDFFAAFHPEGVAYRVEPALGHALPTVDHGHDCGISEPPFLAKCGLPAAGNMLAHIAPNQAPARPQPAIAGRLLRFEQSEFIPLWRRVAGKASFDSHGYVYVPQHCTRARCRVHVALHGCRQGASAVGEAFVRNAGYNRWAEASDAIILYPQVRATEPSWMTWWVPNNPRGCWDWWGYSGSDYAFKRGAQIAAIIAMVDRLGESR